VNAQQRARRAVNAIHAANKVKTVGVTFSGSTSSREYTYLDPFGLKYGDCAAVMSPHNGLTVVYITSVKDPHIALDSDIEYKYLVAPINKTYWEEITAHTDNMYQDVLNAQKWEEINDALSDIPTSVLQKYVYDD